ncbi:mannosyltransferase [Scheffersomyces amazonensis]|uniref:mannosyltransferase n=1 Tax=Scheffersomyces amazonensis TaxID=1078765 RepID=UPI00315D76D2
MSELRHHFRSRPRLIYYIGGILVLIFLNTFLYLPFSSSPANLQARYKYDSHKESIYQLKPMEDLIPEEKVGFNPEEEKLKEEEAKAAAEKAKLNPTYDYSPIPSELPSSKFDHLSDPSLISKFPFKLLHKQLKIADHRQEYDTHSTIYDLIFKSHDPLSVYGNLDFDQRCQLYFYNLFINNHNWAINPNEALKLENREFFDFFDFKEKFQDAYIKEYMEIIGLDDPIEDFEPDDDYEKFVNLKYKEFWERTQITEQSIIDYISHVRIFNKCFVSNNEIKSVKSLPTFFNDQKSILKDWLTIQNKEEGKSYFKSATIPEFQLTRQENLFNFDSFESCANIESRIYPWLSFDYPVYEKWTGEVFLSPPVIKTAPKSSTAKSKTSSIYSNSKHKSCFLEKFKLATNGKGITLSISDLHVPDTIRLIHLLRGLNNKLPIQIVYYDNLSKDSKNRLVAAAREQFTGLPRSFNKVKHLFPADYLDPVDKGLPKQELWFVNVYNAVNENYHDKFKRFGNKFLATLFNSFEEFILIDADTVMVQPPEYFFNLKGYLDKGAYFFKDRTAVTLRPRSDTAFFKKISPSIIDQTMFNIPIITDHTMDNPLMNGMYHYMESGLVAINRNKHYNSILLMFQLAFMEPVAHRVYGDKELFWLAFSLNGDEEYVFNELHAAAIGERTPDEEYVTEAGEMRDGQEVCGAHPGHISGEDGKSLLWFNSGFKFCTQNHNVDFEKEFELKKHFRHLQSIEEMKTFYTQPMKLKHAVIPPFKSKNDLVNENVEDQPAQGWIENKDYCFSYLWCAYSMVGGTTENGVDNTQLGKFIEFDKVSQTLFEYYGDIWVGND